MTSAHRRFAALALTVVAGLLLALGGTLAYVRAEIVDGRAFGERLVSSLDDEAVRNVVGERAVDALVNASAGDLLTVRPLATAAVQSLVVTAPFRRVAALAAADAHRALVTGDTSLIFELARAGPLFVDALRALAPDAAAQTAPEPPVPVAELGADASELDGVRLLVDVARWWWLVLGGALLAGAGAVLVTPDRRRAIGRLGAAAAGAGALVAAAVTVAGAAVVAHLGTVAGLEDDAARDAISAVWTALFGDLRTAGLLFGAAGLLVAAIAGGIADPRRPIERAAAWLRSRRVPRWARSAALLGTGVLCLLAPDVAVRALMAGAGATLLYLGASGLAAQVTASAPSDGRSARRSLLVGGTLVAALAACTIGAVIALSPPEVPQILPAQRASAGCNGSRALCDRRLNEVVFAGTHNSYAAADRPGWLFANQRFPISRQLRDGIRGLLIDVHYGVLDERSGRVRTDIEADGTSRNKIAQELGPEALRAADRIAGRIGAGTLVGTRRPYLCHGLCELGAEPLDQELVVIRRFLEREPTEVIVVVVEDYVAPEEIERSLRRTGLLPYAAELDRSAPLPTLGELVASNRRVVLFAEDKGGTRPWYPPAFTYIQDTPLGATRPDELRCDRFRGYRDSPILLMNHWIDRFPPRPSDHEPINQAGFLRARIDRCTAERGLRPGVIAVDFYERGDTIDVARALNE